jgi:molecular chaperone HtpG
VAEKLTDLFKTDRDGYEKKWESIGLFVKYGMISDDKFYDRAKNIGLLKNMSGKFFTFDEYLDHIAPNQTDKNGNRVIIYTNDRAAQDAYIQSALKKDYDVVQFDNIIDNHFIGALEQKLEKVSVKRVDADISNKLIDKDENLESVLSKEEEEKIKEIFKKAIGDDKLEPEVAALSAEEMPVTITLPEFMRRMQEMAELQGMMGGGMMPDAKNVTINGNHSQTGL